MATPAFPPAEFETRQARAWEAMAETNLKAIVAYAMPNVFWLTGYRGPGQAGAIAGYMQQVVAPKVVLPLGHAPSLAGLLNFAPAYAQETYVKDIRVAIAPVPGRPRHVRDVLQSHGIASGRIGVDLHAFGGINPGELDALRRELHAYEMVDCTRLLGELRMVKSPLEVASIRKAVQIQNEAFQTFRSRLSMKMTEADVTFEMLRCQHEAGAGEPGLVLSAYHPTGAMFAASLSHRRPNPGEIQWFDAGVSVNGYVCDFDLLIAWGEPSAAQRAVHRQIRGAYDDALTRWKPGRRLVDIATDTVAVLDQHGVNDPLNGSFLGHCLGAEVVERPWISVAGSAEQVLRPNMVLAPEWVTRSDVGTFLWERNYLVTETGLERLSDPALDELCVVSH